MAKDEQLVILVEARVADLERNMKRAQQTTARSFQKMTDESRKAARAMERDMAGAGARIGQALTRGLKGSAAGIVGLLGVNELRKAVDEYTKLGNRFRSQGFDAAQVSEAQAKTVQIALASNAALSETGDLYSKLVALSSQYGLTQRDAATATQAIAQALSMAGVDANTAAGTITQLGQAIGSGVLRGDEFNSVMEGLGAQSPLIRALADEFGVTTQELRGLAEAGELVGGRVLRAIIKAGPEIEKSFGKSITTVEASFTNLQTAAGFLAGELNQTLGVSSRLASVFEALAGAATQAGEAIRNARAAEAQSAATVPYATPQAYTDAERASLSRNGIQIGDPREVNRGLALMRMAREDAAQRAGIIDTTSNYGGPNEATRGQALAFRSNTVSPAAAATGGSAAGGGGGGASPDQYQRQIDLIKEQTDALGLDQAAIGKTAFEVAKMRAEAELENAAKAAGIKLTAAQRAEIEGLAATYATASVALENAREQQAAMNDLQQEFKSISMDVFSSLIDGGKDFSQVLSDIAKRLAEAALQAAIFGEGPLRGLFGGGGGLLGGLFGGASGGLAGSVANGGLGFAGLFANGGTIPSGKVGIVGEGGRPELVRGPASVTPLVTGMGIRGRPAPDASSAPVINLSIDARGSTPDAVRLLEKRIPSIVQHTIAQARTRGML